MSQVLIMNNISEVVLVYDKIIIIMTFHYVFVGYVFVVSPLH